MRFMLAIATLSAMAALAFGVLATQATGQAQLAATPDDGGVGGVGGALSYRATVVTPGRGHARALQLAYARAHGRTGALPPKPHELLEATHRRVLWALATFALEDGTVVAERFSWRRGEGWRALGPTRAACPAVPPEVRSAWRRTACQR
jgi:hypothetical protein